MSFIDALLAEHRLVSGDRAEVSRRDIERFYHACFMMALDQHPGAFGRFLEGAIHLAWQEARAAMPLLPGVRHAHDAASLHGLRVLEGGRQDGAR